MWFKQKRLTIDYPKELIKKFMEKQEDREFVGFDFSSTELEAIQKGFEEAKKIKDKCEKNE